MEHNHMLTGLGPVPRLRSQQAQAQHERLAAHGLPPMFLADKAAATSPNSNVGLHMPQQAQQHYPRPSPASTDPFLFKHQASPRPSYLLSSPPTSLHDPTSSFPDAPSTELAPIQLHHSGINNTLPSLSTVTGPPRYSNSNIHSPSPPQPFAWPSLNPLTSYYASSHAPEAAPHYRMDLDMTASQRMTSPARTTNGRASSVSLDDPDVRMAAEALGDLRADLQPSPKHNASDPSSPPNPLDPNDPQEPLLSLLTTSHPLLATTIEGATSAYNTSKNFSPRFKSGAEYVEGYLTPLANTVGSVGRVTGVEGGVRWFLGAGRRHQSVSDLEADDRGDNKRRKVDASSEKLLDYMADHIPDQDVYGPSKKDRSTSMSTVDTLPAYDDYRSPAYSESPESGNNNQVSSRPSSGQSTAWQQRLIMSTSGLSIAMSEESLRSLKYCLRWLRWANEHIGKVIENLKATVEQRSRDGSTTPRPESTQSGEDHDMVDASPDDDASRRDSTEMAARINALKAEVLKTLRDVIETVSRYAGGALPENARVLVRRHLTSLPQRFRLAAMQGASAQPEGRDIEQQAKDVREGAQRVLVLAKEGLDMMAQVSGVLDGTISSAEEWCDRLGRKKQEERDALMTPSRTWTETEPLTGVRIDGDVKMAL